MGTYGAAAAIGRRAQKTSENTRSETNHASDAEVDALDGWIGNHSGAVAARREGFLPPR